MRTIIKTDLACHRHLFGQSHNLSFSAFYYEKERVENPADDVCVERLNFKTLRMVSKEIIKKARFNPRLVLLRFKPSRQETGHQSKEGSTLSPQGAPPRLPMVFSNLTSNFSVLKKCSGKSDCLIYDRNAFKKGEETKFEPHSRQ